MTGNGRQRDETAAAARVVALWSSVDVSVCFPVVAEFTLCKNPTAAAIKTTTKDDKPVGDTFALQVWNSHRLVDLGSTHGCAPAVFVWLGLLPSTRPTGDTIRGGNGRGTCARALRAVSVQLNRCVDTSRVVADLF